MRSVLILLLVAFAVAASRNSDVIELDADNFDANVGNGESWMVEFMAPWCGACKQLKGPYAAAAKQAKGKANFAVVDATKYRSLSIRFGVNGFPTLFHITNGTQVRKVIASHTADALAHFATKGWEAIKEPMTEATSPMGLWGKTKFGGAYHLERIFSLHEPVAEKLGVPSTIVLFVFMFGGVMLLTSALIGFAVWLGPRKPKPRAHAE